MKPTTQQIMTGVKYIAVILAAVSALNLIMLLLPFAWSNAPQAQRDLLVRVQQSPLWAITAVLAITLIAFFLRKLIPILVTIAVAGLFLSWNPLIVKISIALWPVLILIGAGTFWFYGNWWFQQHGTPIELPRGSSIGAILAMFLLTFVWIKEWAVDWTWELGLLNIALIVAAFTCIVAAAIAYSQIWRRPPFDEAIEKLVRADLATRRFLDKARTLRERKSWGSWHCLTTVRQYYLEQYNKLMQEVSASEHGEKFSSDKETKSPLELYWLAGQSLITYLRLRWPENTLPEAECCAEILRTLREMTTLRLWFYEDKTLAPLLEDIQEGDVEPLAEIQALFTTYSEQCASTEPCSKPDYLKFLNYVLFERPACPFPVDYAFLQEVLTRFKQLSIDDKIPDCAAWRRLLANTWLATSACVGAPAFDVWLKMVSPFQTSYSALYADLGSTRTEDIDVADSCARQLLPTYYPEDKSSTPSAYENAGLKQIGDHLRDTAKQNRKANLKDDLSPTLKPNWHYAYVWKASPIWLLLRGSVLASLVGAILLVSLTSPLAKLFPVANWNSIDHVTDRRFGWDYTPAAATALAGCGNQLGIGTDNGLTIIDVETRIAREQVVSDPVLDVRCTPDGFLVLKADQSAVMVRSGDLEAAVWLPMPSQPQLTLPNFNYQTDIVANHLDEHGWLLAIKGYGLVRYAFESGAGGEPIRTRSWQTGDLINVPLESAVITQIGTWVRLPGGIIRFADLNLKESLERKLGPQNLVDFQASYDGRWAEAIDNQHRVWLFTADQNRWQGPFLEYMPGNCSPLDGSDAAKAFNLARAVTSSVWLSTGKSIYVYDTAQRRLVCALSTFNAAWMDVLPSSDKRSSPVVIFAGESGLQWVESPKAGTTYNPLTLESAPIRSIGASASGNLLVYLDSNQTVQNVRAPTLNAQSSTLIPADGWTRLTTAPRPMGTVSLASGLVFATAGDGAFVYNPATHVYADFSTISSPGGYQRQAKTFSRLRLEEGVLLAIADGTPLMWTNAQSTTRYQWLSLDSDRTSQATSLTQIGGKLYGTSSNGILYRYSASTSSPQALFETKADAISSTDKVYTALGDLTVRSSSWNTAFLKDTSLITYDSDIGRLAQTPLPYAVQQEQNVAQLRLAHDKPLYLMKNGPILNASGTDIFGTGALPFAPTKIANIAPRLTKNQVLVTSTDGQVWAYDWQRGSWSSQDSLTLSDQQRIVEMEDTNAGIFVRLNTGAVYRNSGGGWSPQSDTVHWGFNAPNMWFLSEDRVTGPDRTFSTGAGMRDFVRSARYVWQADNGMTLFFSDRSAIGLFDTKTDSWRVIDSSLLGTLRQFELVGRDLLILDENGVVRFPANLNGLAFSDDVSASGQRVARVPGNADALSMHVAGDSLQVVSVADGAVLLQSWDQIGSSTPRLVSRGTNPMPANFALSDVVFAEKENDGSALRFVDNQGNIARYTFANGQWESIRSAAPGEKVYGWFAPTPSSGLHLILATDAGTRIVRISDGQLFSTSTYAPKALIQRDQQALQTLIALAQSLGAAPDRDRLIAWMEASGYLVTDSHITFASDGMLLDAGTFQVMRQQGTTVYRADFGIGLQPLQKPTAAGFAEDRIASAAFSADGTLWAVQLGRVLKLVTTPSGDGLMPSLAGLNSAYNQPVALDNLPGKALRLSFASGGPLILQGSPSGLIPIDAPSALVNLAEYDYAGFKLAWTWQIDQTIHADWSDSRLPVWDDNGRLALQTLTDMGLSNDNDLLLVSKIGLQVRDATTYQLKTLLPDLNNVQLIKLSGVQRLLIQRGGGFIGEWKDHQVAPVSDPASIVETALVGAWQWQIGYGTPAPLSIHRQDDNAIRSWTDGPSFRFKDDVVTWIAKDRAANALWLLTQDGVWGFAPDTGRTARQTDSDALQRLTQKPQEKLTTDSPVLSVQLAGSSVSFAAPEAANLSVFVNGRFYFDTVTESVGSGGKLYLLLPGRGIIARDPDQPTSISGYWTFPADMPMGDGNVYTLRDTTAGLRLEVRIPSAGRSLAWILSPAVKDTSWQASDPLEKQVLAQFGPVIWQFAPPQSGGVETIMPLLNTTSPAPQGIDSWWHTDRFGWDAINAVGALDDSTTLLSTALGPMALKLDDSDASKSQISALWLLPTLSQIEVARKDGQPTGLVVSDSAYQTPYLATLDDQKHVTLTPLGASAALPVYRTVLTLDYVGQGADRRVDFVPSWVLKTSSTPAVSSNIAILPTNALIQGGRFAFDDALTASPSQGNSTAAWGISSGCGEAKASCPMTLNQLDSGGGFTLRDVFNSPPLLTALRPASPTGLYALSVPASGPTTAYQGQFTDEGQMDWKPTDLASTGDTFRVGDMVNLNVPDLTWTATSKYPWPTDKPFQFAPAAYPLLASNAAGVAFTFDIFTSLDITSNNQRLLVGTQGGLMIVPYDSNRMPLTASKAYLSLNGNPLGIDRVRRDERGDFWVKAGNQTSKLSLSFAAPNPKATDRPNTVWTSTTVSWPGDYAFYGGLTIHVDGNGIDTACARFETSNDAWGEPTFPLTEIVDFYPDPPRQAIWLLTKSRGVFKIIPSALGCTGRLGESNATIHQLLARR